MDGRIATEELALALDTLQRWHTSKDLPAIQRRGIAQEVADHFDLHDRALELIRERLARRLR